MYQAVNLIDTFDSIAHLLAMIIFIIGMISTTLVFWKKKTVSSIFLVFLMIGGFLFSLSDLIEKSNLWGEEIADQFADSFIIFLASIILIIGFIVILEQKLKTSEQKFRHLFENSPYSVVLLDLNETVVDCNIATTELFGIKKEDLLNRKFSEFFPDPLKLSSSLKERIIVIKKGIILKPLEEQLQKKNGPLIWVSFQTSLFELDNEPFLQVILQDITERKGVEILIKKEIEKLKEIEQIRSSLIRRTSHELKTPLISIYSTTQYILNNLKEELTEEVLKFVETINRGGERLKIFTNNLIDVYNLEFDEFKLEKRKVNINTCITDCVNDLNLFLKTRDLHLKIDFGKELDLEVDKQRIEQVILNLLSNAIKNTPPKGIIYIKTQKKNNDIDIVIKDTGVGFTKDEQEIIFKEFGKIERNDEGLNIDREGSGLGLYISKKIVDLHGGKIWMDSEGRNKGSTFTVRLPIN